jgi:hypothetical protein
MSLGLAARHTRPEVLLTGNDCAIFTKAGSREKYVHGITTW